MKGLWSSESCAQDLVRNSTIDMSCRNANPKTRMIDSYVENLFRWRSGRQDTGYEKMLLLINPFLIPFDLYLLRFREGAEIPSHTDPVREKRHFRLNIIIRQARRGGEFICSDPIFETHRIKLFRPDISPHSVTRIKKGSRYVLSLGWTWGSADKKSHEDS